MADTTQGITLDVDPAAADPQGQQTPATPAAAFDPSPYLPDVQPAPSQPGVTPGQTAITPPVFDAAKHFQSIADQRLAENLRLQQELQRYQQSQPTPASSGAIQPNPFDPQKDWASWMRFENQQAARMASQEALQGFRQELQGVLQQSAEAQWAQGHPGTDINAVKAFAQMRGIRDLNDAFALMTLPNQLAQVQSQTAQSTLQQFRQPVQGATPIRGSQSTATPQAQQMSYVKLAEAYANNPNIEASWPAEVRDAFWKETNARQSA